MRVERNMTLTHEPLVLLKQQLLLLQLQSWAAWHMRVKPRYMPPASLAPPPASAGPALETLLLGCTAPFQACTAHAAVSNAQRNSDLGNANVRRPGVLVTRQKTQGARSKGCSRQFDLVCLLAAHENRCNCSLGQLARCPIPC